MSIENMDVGIQNDGEPVAVEKTPIEPPTESLAEAGESAGENAGEDAGKQEGEEVGQPEETQEEARKRKSGSQREREKRMRLEAENEALRSLLTKGQEGKPSTAPPIPVDPNGKPKPSAEQFDTHEEWVEALSDWKYDQRRAAERAESERNAAQTEWAKKCAEGREKFPDFDDLIQDAPAPSPLVAQRLFKPSTTPEVIHYLASNLEEYERINRLKDPGDVAEALAEIRVKLKSPPPKTKTPSAAPAPIRPVTPRAAVIVPERLRGIEDF